MSKEEEMFKVNWLETCFNMIEEYIPISINADKKHHDSRIKFYSIENHAFCVIKRVI
jgi:hypothetical protein